MPERARLLDMGQVGPLRAHGLRLALTEALARQDGPVVLVACAATPAVTLGEERELPAEIDLEACAARRITVLRLPGDSPAAPIAEGALWLSLLLPAASAAKLCLPTGAGGGHAWMAGLLAAAGGAATSDSAIDVEAAAGGVALTACLGFGGSETLRGALLRQPVAGRGTSRQGSVPPTPAEVAELLLQQLEQRVGLEMVPSMPTPDELDAVYEWERKLAAKAVQPDSQAAAAPAV